MLIKGSLHKYANAHRYILRCHIHCDLKKCVNELIVVWGKAEVICLLKLQRTLVLLSFKCFYISLVIVSICHLDPQITSSLPPKQSNATQHP